MSSAARKPKKNEIDPTHPIFSPVDFAIDTPMVDAFIEQVNRWLWYGFTGAFIRGHSREGKSRAIEMAIHCLTNRLGEPVPAHHLIIHDRDTKTRKSICIQSSETMQVKFQFRDSTDILISNLLHFLSECALTTTTKQVVLFVDEAQRLLLKQYGPFLEIYDKLRRMKINCMVIFVANDDESEPLLNRVKHKQYRHLQGRFFVHQHEFVAIKSKKDVLYCLQQYDTRRYPPDGDTYTQHFLRDAWDSGFRLASLTNLFWRVYVDEFKKPMKLPSLGMQYFITPINQLLMTDLPAYGVDTPDLDVLIANAIVQSGLPCAE